MGSKKSINFRYIPAEEIPFQYGGLKPDNDPDFSSKGGGAMELSVKPESTKTIEIPVLVKEFFQCLLFVVFRSFYPTFLYTYLA